MALSRPDRELATMLGTLATPGGITELGLDVLRQRQGLEAWAAALDAVLGRMQGDPERGAGTGTEPNLKHQ
jgi:pyrroline-5-carboxylate reductase